MVADLLALLEASALGQVARSSSWFFPLSNIAHVLGGALLVGAIAVFDVLLLRRRYEIAAAISGFKSSHFCIYSRRSFFNFSIS